MFLWIMRVILLNRGTCISSCGDLSDVFFQYLYMPGTVGHIPLGTFQYQ